MPAMKDRVEQEHVLQVLAAGIGVVDGEEVTRLQRLHWIERPKGLEDVTDRAELHRDQLSLRHRVAVRVQQRGRPVARFPQDGRIGGAHQLHAHLARRRDQRLADDGVVDRIKRHGAVPCRRMLPCASGTARHPGGTQVLEL
jgi:hypothetical protein